MSQESNQVLVEQIVRARNHAHAQLSRYARQDSGVCREAYLFEDDHFCGIRFWLGPFRAVWMIAEPTMQFFRENNQIGQAELDPTTKKRAA